MLRKVDLGGFRSQFPDRAGSGRDRGRRALQCGDRQGQPGGGARRHARSGPIVSAGERHQRARAAGGRRRPPLAPGARRARRGGRRRVWPACWCWPARSPPAPARAPRKPPRSRCSEPRAVRSSPLYILEYGAVGVIAGLAGVALGYAAAWPVVVPGVRSDMERRLERRGGADRRRGRIGRRGRPAGRRRSPGAASGAHPARRLRIFPPI